MGGDVSCDVEAVYPTYPFNKIRINNCILYTTIGSCDSEVMQYSLRRLCPDFVNTKAYLISMNISEYCGDPSATE